MTAQSVLAWMICFPPDTSQLATPVIGRLLVPPWVLTPSTYSGKIGIAIATVCTSPSALPVAMYTFLPKNMTLTLEATVSFPTLLVIHGPVVHAVSVTFMGALASARTPPLQAYLKWVQSDQFADPVELQLFFQVSLKSQLLLVSGFPAWAPNWDAFHSPPCSACCF